MSLGTLTFPVEFLDCEKVFPPLLSEYLFKKLNLGLSLSDFLVYLSSIFTTLGKF